VQSLSKKHIGKPHGPSIGMAQNDAEVGAGYLYKLKAAAEVIPLTENL
jgi:hypothetical protein